MSIHPEPPDQNSIGQTNQEQAEGYQTKVGGGEADIGSTINVYKSYKPNGT